MTLVNYLDLIQEPAGISMLLKLQLLVYVFLGGVRNLISLQHCLPAKLRIYLHYNRKKCHSRTVVV